MSGRTRRLRGAVVATTATALSALTFVGLHGTAAGAAPATLPGVPNSAVAALTSANNPIPPGAVFVSNTGNDSSAGTQAAPLQTIEHALAITPDGGTIVVRAGTYREGSSASIYRNLTLESYPGEQVWMDGSDVVGGWTATGAIWSHPWSTPSFCNGQYYTRSYLQQDPGDQGPCTHIDMANDPSNPAAGDPQMAFVNGAPLREVTSLAAVTAGAFFYDQSARVMYLGSNPTGATVELSSRPNALVLQGGTGFTIRGIGFRRFASNEFTGNVTSAAVLVNDPNVSISNSAFTQQAATGVAFANPAGGSVTRSWFGDNGFNGLDGNGHQHSSGSPDNLNIQSDMFDGNNTELFGTGCSLSCSAAGSKLAHMDGFTLKGNIFQNGQGVEHGFWCDLACTNGVMVDNVFRNNGGTGLFYEVSNTGIIASNLMQQNRAYGLKLGSANTSVFNNALFDNGTNVLIYDDTRSYGVGGWTDVGPDTANVTFFNNVLSGGTGGIDVSLWRTSSTPPNTGPNTFIAGFDDNSYFRPNGVPGTLVDWRDGSSTEYTSLAALQSRGVEGHGSDVLAAAPATAVPGSTALLPSVVASLVGVPATQSGQRGVLALPISSGGTPPPPPPPPPPGGPNLQSGAWFETPKTTWNPFGAAVIATTTAAAHGGSRSLSISSTASAAAVTGATGMPVAVPNVAPGQRYVGRCWVMSPVPATARVRFQEYSQTWQRLTDPADSATVVLSTPGTWYPVSVSYVGQNSGAQLPFSVYSTALRAGGPPMYVDDCTVQAP